MMNDWQKFRQLTAQEIGLLVQALVILPLVSLGLDVLGWQHLRRLLERLAGRRQRPLTEQPPDTMRQAARMTDVAAGHKFLRATCLRRSVALWWLLQRQGIDSRVVLGVRKGDRWLQAHAWVECEGVVLNDRPAVRAEFAIFDEV